MTRTALRLLPLLILGAACGAKEDSPDMMNGTAGTSPVAGMTAGAMAGTTAGAMAGTGGMAAGVGGAAGEMTAGVGGAGAGGAGAGGEAGTMPMAGTGAAGMISDPDMGLNPDGTIKETCRGFSFDNILYSPGGTALPNACAPYHPTTNNPYAVRCIDVWPWYDSGWPGDQFCILPPPPELGLQYGVHPQGKDWFAEVSTGDMSGYERANIGPDFILAPAGEGERNYATTIPITEPRNYYRNNARMRSGSHHMIVANLNNSQAPETWGPGAPVGLMAGTDSLPGAQRPDENTPKSLEKPAEDAGYFAELKNGLTIIFDMHHFNATDEDILKEAWTNIWYEEDATKRVSGLNGLNFLQVATLAVQPGQTVDLHYSYTATAPVRLVTLFGHRHAWTTNFSAWIAEGGQNEVIYQSFNWYDEPTYRYDSLTMNPTPDHTTLADGATSGIRTLQAGQTLHYNCRIQYTDARAAAVMAPKTPAQNGTLGFANEAFTAEMCILFGSTAEGTVGAFNASNSPLPDFATAE